MLVARSAVCLRLAPSLLHRAPARALHAAPVRAAVTKMAMPAMSPTMTEGGLAEWKLQEGQAYAQGDVLLDIETDKATMDVEAPEDGVLAKILVPNGTKDVPVGKTIALLAEEGDDLSNIEIPRDEEPSAAPDASAPATPPASEAPKHVESAASSAAPPATEAHAAVDGTLMPSVARLLTENNIDDPSKIKGTGLHGRLTKGDVLAFLGQASSPTGTYTPPHGGVATLYGGGATPSPAKGTTASASDRQTLTPPQSDKVQTPAGVRP